MSLLDFPVLNTKTVDKKRYYVTPEGNEYPSITTVLSPRGKEGLMKWRKRVGEKTANYICNKAATRGTKVHKMCEDFLNGEDMTHHKKDFLPYCLFNELKDKTFNNINEVIGQEVTLYSDKYKVAGRTDLIAEYKGELSIVDFKTSTNERKDSYNENYYIRMPKGASPLVFPEAELECHPKEGELIVFPGIVKHSVPPCECEEKRIMIASNVGVK